LFTIFPVQSFEKSTVDPLQKKLDAVSAQGQAVIKSAPPGSNTTALETDLESLADRWAELSEKVSLLLMVVSSV
jgi:hypothetical protein